MALPRLETSPHTNSSVADSRIFAGNGRSTRRADLSETFITSEGAYRPSERSAAVCRTVLISENGLFRFGIKQMLEKSRISVIGDGHDIPSLLDAMKMQPIPELVVCHIASAQKDQTVLDFIDNIRQHFIQAKLVVLADAYTRSAFPGLVAADVHAVLLTNISSEMLIQSLELVLFDYRLFPAEVLPVAADGLFQLSPSWAPTENLATLAGTAVLADTHQTRARLPTTAPSSPQLTTRITEREGQVLGCLVRGLSNKCIARELDIVEATVKVYLKLLSRRFRVGNRTQLAIWALQQFAHLDVNLALTNPPADGAPSLLGH
jgi:two-component system, NarL family, nitrate/nitrite response regulator NarL